MNVLYLYSGSRKDKFRGAIGVDYPDTQFYGLNHLSAFGIAAEYKEWSDVTKSRFWDAILNFRIKHLLLYPLTKGYDIVFGSSVLYLVLLQKIWKAPTKFVLLNMGMRRILSANTGNRLKGRFIRWLLDGLDGIVCLSQFQKTFLEERYPSLRGKIFSVPLGVDTEYYRPQYEGRKDYILSAGRDNGRDYKTVVEAARLMPERQFHIVCSPRNLPTDTVVPSNVRVFYDLSFAELYVKYREASMLLLLTHDDSAEDGSDCSGQTVLLDAMACGLPVVVSRKAYVQEYAEDGAEALFVDCYDPNAVKTAIQSLHNVESRISLAQKARERAERDFSTVRMAEALTSVFQQIYNSP